ncbi:MAG: hypothetical protein AVDCRST_MAG89-4537, partial [uncultured Gemmatimonadetes bacterium]
GARAQPGGRAGAGGGVPGAAGRIGHRAPHPLLRGGRGHRRAADRGCHADDGPVRRAALGALRRQGVRRRRTVLRHGGCGPGRAVSPRLADGRVRQEVLPLPFADGRNAGRTASGAGGV